jgi:formylglycine-generating enzyme required for sulfatase activity
MKQTKFSASLSALLSLALLSGCAAHTNDSSALCPAPNSIGMTFAKISPGSFIMGSPENEPGREKDETQHRVTLTHPFMMGTTHVTIAQFRAFVTATGYKTEAEKQGSGFAWTGAKWANVSGASWHRPGFLQQDNHPVVDVSWNDATAFCNWLSQKENKHYRLPTEAEWEYCCRAGSQTIYSWGDDPDDGAGRANCADTTAKQKYSDWPGYFTWTDGFVFTSPVAKFKPNAWGIYDMTGNAWEWCSDWYGKYPDGDVTDPQGPPENQATIIHATDTGTTGPERVMRGGSWHSRPTHARCAKRDHEAPDFRNCIKGFRVVMEIN